MTGFVVAVLLSAFLLFSVQPMVARALLPAFGGTAAVWSTCLVFFQTLLLAGYAYAHLLRVKLSPRQQRWTHLAVLAVALCFLPPVPHVDAAAALAHPLRELLRSLAVAVGVPFFALSATAPLLMEWFRQAHPGRTPDRLYAVSNAGSLLALISYPALIEPQLGGRMQGLCWAGGMGAFVVICGVTAWRTGRGQQGERKGMAGVGSRMEDGESKIERSTRPPQGGAGDRTNIWLWVALAGCGSGLLMALTNQISQDVAPMPLLWVAPLGVYLLTFILCFESRRFYRRRLFMPAGLAGMLALAWLLQEGYLQGFGVQVGAYLGVLFCGCMVCHGELYGLRPPAERLTGYYLAISLGGALGGAFVALAAPALFKTLLETPLLAIAIAILVAFILWRERATTKGGTRNERRFVAWQAALAGTLAIAAAHAYVQWDLRAQSIHFVRNFYGVYRVTESPQFRLNKMDYPLTPGPARVLHSGQIYHGVQFTAPEAAGIATTYYSEEGGLGLAFRNLTATTNRVIGAVGLGAGTVAAYGRAGDRIRFYELNPEVLRMAREYFSFLSRGPATVEVVLGDGRLSLERESPQGYDLLVLDAFSGDAVPAHLLTAEAMETYMRQLKPGGLMAFHISNSHLDLEPVVRALALKHELTAVLCPATQTDVQSAKLPSVWMLLTANPALLRRPEILEVQGRAARMERRPPILWTDDHSSILPILH
jgi:protein-L-isoaspartate O-methyltransferase